MSGNNSENSLSSSTSGDENKIRGNWTGKLDFLMSCLSYAVGLGNLWRFPYLCYRNGGGAFLIPYVFMLVFTGLPLFFLELAFGQFASEGVISIWKVSPIFQGIGWGMFLVSCYIGIYYNMIIAWAFYYLFASIGSDVPWRTCDNPWNTPACNIQDRSSIKNCSSFGGVWYNHSCVTNDTVSPEKFLLISGNATELSHLRYPSDEFFHNNVLGISDGFHDKDEFRWHLALSLLAAWILVGMCLIKGIKSQGRVVYFTATFPYLVLSILLLRCLMLPGSLNGIVYYLTPQWHRLATAKVWGDAAVQIFFSLSPCWGGLITLASYNKFNNNCLRDALIVSVGNCATSFFAGFVVFGIIGFMAAELGLEIENVVDKGAGLAFILYPEVVARLPISPLWAILFFAMLITLGLGTQFSVVTTVHTTLLDVFPSTLRRGYRPTFLMIVICTVMYLLGLNFCFSNGMYRLQLIDNYAATYSLLTLGLFECIAINYVYGVNNFFKDIEMMLGHKPGNWWRVMWCFVTPFLLFGIMIFTWIDYVPSSYRNYDYPAGADALGWVISMSSVSAIPIVAVVKIFTSKGDSSLLKTIKSLSKPTAEWGPAIQRDKDISKNHDYIIPLNSTPQSEPRKKSEEDTSPDANLV